eukprot:TRINITY_DN3261_c0_g1_i1.p1 TRINITY_DN3261_c0_g1~~TRINITY_DN3261_c0_g1_i1.p1  ORF type:complete len:521 (+),score=17.63 TRINITY_DN3261_c0_g1_i1:84-1646(+)
MCKRLAPSPLIVTDSKRVRLEIDCEVKSIHLQMELFAPFSPSGYTSAELPSAFNTLSDDELVLVISSLASASSSPLDLLRLSMTSKRLKALCLHPSVLSQLHPSAISVPYSKWCNGAQLFLQECSDAGNAEASYFLGMVEFYCLRNSGKGMKLLVSAALAGHPDALHSLALIHFNSSGFCKGNDGKHSLDGIKQLRGKRDLRIAVLLCSFAAQRGHLESLRELGHCLQDGYGVQRNVSVGRRLLLEANLRELVNHRISPFPGSAVELQISQMTHIVLKQLLPQEVEENGCISKECPTGASQRLQSLDISLHEVGNVCSILSQSWLDSTISEFASHISQTAARLLHCKVPSRKSLVSRLSTRGVARAGVGATAALSEQTEVSETSMDVASLLHALYDCLGPLMSDFGCSVPERPPHPVNRFLSDWFRSSHCHPRLPEGLKLCANTRCGRPETRQHEFRCCAVCAGPNYCSRACQALDWKTNHMNVCQQEVGRNQRVQRTDSTNDAILESPRMGSIAVTSQR